MSNSTAEKYKVGRCDIEIHYDNDCEYANPRQDDNFGIMVNWHDRYILGDVNGRKEYGDGEAFLRHLANAYAPPRRDYKNSDMEKVLSVVRRHYIVLPLGLYDHSGISIFVGGRSDIAGDSAGWDTSSIGYIYCSLEKARENWMLPKRAGWKTKVKTKKFIPQKVDSVGKVITPGTYGPEYVLTLRERAEELLRAEVQCYDDYLTGQVYGYVVKGDNGEEDSCWGFVGDIDYVKSEAYNIAERMNKRMDEDDARTDLTEKQTELAAVWP